MLQQLVVSFRKIYLRDSVTCRLLQPDLTVITYPGHVYSKRRFINHFIITLTLSVNGSLLRQAGVVTYRTAAVGSPSDLSATGNANDLHLTSRLALTRTNPSVYWPSITATHAAYLCCKTAGLQAVRYGWTEAVFTQQN